MYLYRIRGRRCEDVEMWATRGRGDGAMCRCVDVNSAFRCGIFVELKGMKRQHVRSEIFFSGKPSFGRNEKTTIWKWIEITTQ